MSGRYPALTVVAENSAFEISSDRCQPIGELDRVTNVGITEQNTGREVGAAEIIEGYLDISDEAITVESFDDFYRREYRAVVGLAYALTGSRGASEELAQDAFVAAFRGWGRISGYERPESWVRRVLVNNCRSRGRRLGAELRAVTKIGGRRERLAELPDPDHEFWAAVRALPERQAQSVVLHYLEDRPLDEIGEILGCTVGSVKQHLYRGRQSLATRLNLETTAEEPIGADGPTDVEEQAEDIGGTNGSER